MNYGTTIKEVRRLRGITQLKAKVEMKIGLSTLRQIEQGLPAVRPDVVKRVEAWLDKYDKILNGKRTQKD